MITAKEIEGNWDQLKGRLQEKWGTLTDDDLGRAKGNVNQLVGVIEQKTGESRRAIESFLDEAMAGGASVVSQVTDKAREYAAQAGEGISHGYQEVAERVRSGYDAAGEGVRRHPVESLTSAFGAGLVAGVVVGIVLTRR